ncbi:hypothetical protein DFQ26_009417, partial [Actinomortierella ambigua]
MSCSILFNLQAKQRQQRAKRTRTQSGTALEANDSNSNATEGVRPLSTETELFKVKLGLALFGLHPLKHEHCALNYLATGMSLPAPAPNAADYLTYMKETYPGAPAGGVVRTWSKLKRHFEDAEADHSGVEDLINVDSLIGAFGKASFIKTSDWTTMSSAPPTPELAPVMHLPLMATPRAAKSSSTRATRASSSPPPPSSNRSSKRSRSRAAVEAASQR